MMLTLRDGLSGVRAAGVRRAARVVHVADDGAALLIALMTILVAGALSIAVLGTVLAQVTPAQFNQKNVRTVHAAEAGIDVALGRFRSAETVDLANPSVTVGDRRELPCVAGQRYGQLDGSIAGAPGGLGYRVRVEYFSQDPAGQTRAWRDANRLICTSTGAPALTPNYALITSEGFGDGVPDSSATLGDRTLETIYDFRLTNQNIAGGLIANFPDGNSGSLRLCFDAGSEAPAVGDRLRVQLCDPGNPRQLWSWNTNSTVSFAPSQADPLGALCVAGMDATSSTVTSTTLTMQRCNGADYRQKWGFEDNASFAGRLRNTSPTSNTSKYCIYIAQDNTAGSFVNAGTGNPGCSSGTGTYNRIRTWRPDARVGAGKAGAVEGNVSGTQFQWVNFYEFGRCFDVTNWTWSYSFMIAFPCKQDVSGYVGWNQTLQWDESPKGWLYTYASTNGRTFDQARSDGVPQRCLLAPTSNGGRVTLTACDSNEPRHTWKVWRERGTYAESYTIEDSNGRCLSIGLPGVSSGDLAQWSTIVTETCDGSARQKWNAPPDAAPTALRDTQELD